MRIATESEEQRSLIRYINVETARFPELAMFFHVPNEGKRDPRTGRRLKSEGLRRGVPDIFLDVAQGGYHGLRIELKRVKGSHKTKEQKEWILRLNDEGYAAAFCYGWWEAWVFIEAYLTGEYQTVRKYIRRSIDEAEGKRRSANVVLLPEKKE